MKPLRRTFETVGIELNFHRHRLRTFDSSLRGRQREKVGNGFMRRRRHGKAPLKPQLDDRLEGHRWHGELDVATVEDRASFADFEFVDFSFND